MVGNKKSTGMGKRSGFLDRDTIAEDRAILRYNESLEEEARRALRPANASGPSGERGRGSRGDGRRGEGGPGGGRGEGARGPRRGGGDRAGGAPRAPRPPAVEPEVEARLREAAAAAGEERSLAAEASRLVDRLVRGAKFEVAATAGWDLLVENRGTEHTPKQWDALRKEWDAVRQAVGDVWGETHPDDKPAPIKIRAPRKRRGGKQRGGADQSGVRGPGAPAGSEAAEEAADVAEVDVEAAAAVGTEGLEHRKSRRRRRGGRGRGRRAARPVFVPTSGQVVPIAVVVTVVTPARPAGARRRPEDEELSEAELLAAMPAPDLATELASEAGDTDVDVEDGAAELAVEVQGAVEVEGAATGDAEVESAATGDGEAAAPVDGAPVADGDVDASGVHGVEPGGDVPAPEEPPVPEATASEEPAVPEAAEPEQVDDQAVAPAAEEAERAPGEA